MTPGGQFSRQSTLKTDFDQDEATDEMTATDKIKKKLRNKMHKKISAIKKNQEQMKSSLNEVYAFEKLATSDPNHIDDKIIKYGPGIASYFSVIVGLIKILTVLSLCGVATMCAFAFSGEADQGYVGSVTTPFTFGNLGFEKPMCLTHPLTATTEMV